MKILQIMKPDLAGIRNKMASDYRELRKENPAKARLLFRNMRAAMNLTERQLQDNLFFGAPVIMHVRDSRGTFTFEQWQKMPPEIPPPLKPLWRA